MFSTPLRTIADSEESCLIVAKGRDAVRVEDTVCTSVLDDEGRYTIDGADGINSPLLVEEGRDAIVGADGVVNV